MGAKALSTTGTLSHLLIAPTQGVGTVPRMGSGGVLVIAQQPALWGKTGAPAAQSLRCPWCTRPRWG